jgi:hypothetical protein
MVNGGAERMAAQMQGRGKQPAMSDNEEGDLAAVKNRERKKRGKLGLSGMPSCRYDGPGYPACAPVAKVYRRPAYVGRRISLLAA